MPAGKPVRHAAMIGLAPGAEARYRELHAAVWPQVLDTLRAHGFSNYSIFLRGNTLFAYYEYLGDDHAADMAGIAADPVTQEWWTLTDPTQVPPADAGPGERWVELDEVFHLS